MSTIKEKVERKIVELLESSPEGIRYSVLAQKIHEALPEVNVSYIHHIMCNYLRLNYPNIIYKPAKGIWRLTRFKEIDTSEKESSMATNETTEKIKEEDFYRPFADYLVNELEECTKAIPLGGNKFRDKWGTPDVIGIREPKKSDIIKFNTEVISSEIKIDTNSLITAFGQACAYKLFSHKSYIVVPKSASEEDLSKLDSLCLIFGIGLVLFDPTNPNEPKFEIRVRPAKHEPDMFYVNKYLKLIEDELFG